MARTLHVEGKSLGDLHQLPLPGMRVRTSRWVYVKGGVNPSIPAPHCEGRPVKEGPFTAPPREDVFRHRKVRGQAQFWCITAIPALSASLGPFQSTPPTFEEYFAGIGGVDRLGSSPAWTSRRRSRRPGRGSAAGPDVEGHVVEGVHAGESIYGSPGTDQFTQKSPFPPRAAVNHVILIKAIIDIVKYNAFREA